MTEGYPQPDFRSQGAVIAGHPSRAQKLPAPPVIE